MTEPRPRDDVLVSVGIVAAHDRGCGTDRLVRLAGLLAARFRYWELLYVTDVLDTRVDEAAARRVRNLRLLRLRPETPLHRRRLCIANEAIGDVLVISAPDELDDAPILDMIEECERTGAIVILRREGRMVFNAGLIALGRSAGFRVDLRDMATAAYPRALVSRLVKHPDASLALRFPPIDPGIPAVVRRSEAPRRARIRAQGGAGRRLLLRASLLQKIVLSSAPRILAPIQLLSLVVAGTAFLYILYATTAWLTFAHVQPGWYTTSLLQGSTAIFLGVAVFGLAIGQERLLALATEQVADDVVDEIDSTDLFGSVIHDLNVDLDGPLVRSEDVGRPAPVDASPQ